LTTIRGPVFVQSDYTKSPPVGSNRYGSSPPPNIGITSVEKDKLVGLLPVDRDENTPCEIWLNIKNVVFEKQGNSIDYMHIDELLGPACNSLWLHKASLDS
jgi:hypothetical protein